MTRRPAPLEAVDCGWHAGDDPAGPYACADIPDPDFGARATPAAVTHLVATLLTLRRYGCDPGALLEAIGRQVDATAVWKIGGLLDPSNDEGRLTLYAEMFRCVIDGTECTRADAVLILGEAAVCEAELQRAAQVFEGCA